MALLLGVSLVVALPWYVYTEVEIFRGLQRSELEPVLVANHGSTIFAHLQHAWDLLLSAFDAITLAVAAMFHSAGLALRDKSKRLDPPGRFRSRAADLGRHDQLRHAQFGAGRRPGMRRHGHRNWDSPATIRRVWKSWPSILQQLAVVAAGGRDRGRRFISVPSLAAPVFEAAAGLSAARGRRDPSFNKVLYELLASGKVHHYFLTNYHIAPYLPEIKTHFWFNSFTDIAITTPLIDRLQPEYLAVLRHPTPREAVDGEELQRHIADGTWSIYAEGPYFYVIERHRVPLPRSERDFHFGIYEVVSGLDVPEVRIRSGNLPQLVRWAAGFETRLRFDAKEAGTRELRMEIPFF